MKKNFSHQKADEKACRLFKKKIGIYELTRIPLVYIDESGFSEDMPRISGYAPEGMRNMTGCRSGALTGDRLLTAALFDGSINTDVFEAWLQQGLLPVPPKGAAAVMDNAQFHKSERIQEAVEAAGCLLEYLPPYSPDLNPIEYKWAQAKSLRRKIGCSTDELFQQAIL